DRGGRRIDPLGPFLPSAGFLLDSTGPTDPLVSRAARGRRAGRDRQGSAPAAPRRGPRRGRRPQVCRSPATGLMSGVLGTLLASTMTAAFPTTSAQRPGPERTKAAQRCTGARLRLSAGDGGSGLSGWVGSTVLKGLGARLPLA